MSSLLETFIDFLRNLRRSKCHRLIKYQTRVIEFKGLNIEGIGDAKISLGGFSHEIRNIVDSIPERAQALDDYQFRIWMLLTDPNLRDDLIVEERRMYRLALFGANQFMLHLRSDLQAAQQNPIGQRDNLSATLNEIQSFVSSASPPKITTERQRKAISDAVIGFTTKAKTKLWSVDNREAQVLSESNKLRNRLMQVIRDKNLSSKLSKGGDSTISEIEEVLISNGIVRTEEKSKEYANTITRLQDKAVKGEQITLDEFGEYILLQWHGLKWN